MNKHIIVMEVCFNTIMTTISLKSMMCILNKLQKTYLVVFTKIQLKYTYSFSRFSLFASHLGFLKRLLMRLLTRLLMIGLTLLFGQVLFLPDNCGIQCLHDF
ncbi:hypothetical protein BY458DRAFT_490314 [Sporodiniella umbellata]|nr:hypothetical protein BY458DRAFT_490314 [Sporodiniella umbellata]